MKTHINIDHSQNTSGDSGLRVGHHPLLSTPRGCGIQTWEQWVRQFEAPDTSLDILQHLIHIGFDVPWDLHKATSSQAEHYSQYQERVKYYFKIANGYRHIHRVLTQQEVGSTWDTSQNIFKQSYPESLRSLARQAMCVLINKFFSVSDNTTVQFIERTMFYGMLQEVVDFLRVIYSDADVAHIYNLQPPKDDGDKVSDSVTRVELSSTQYQAMQAFLQKMFEEIFYFERRERHHIPPEARAFFQELVRKFKARLVPLVAETGFSHILLHPLARCSKDVLDAFEKHVFDQQFDVLSKKGDRIERRLLVNGWEDLSLVVDSCGYRRGYCHHLLLYQRRYSELMKP